MDNVKKIVCPIDFSDHSKKALKVSVSLCKQYSAELVLVHVVATVPLLEISRDSVPVHFDVPSYQREIVSEAEEGLKSLAENRVPSDIDVELVVMDGDSAEEIVETAKKEKADLIVMATHGRTGWKHFVLGSVTEKVIRTAPCFVLTIPAKKTE